MTRVNEISVFFFFFFFLIYALGAEIINVINTLIESAEMKECPMKWAQSRLINSISFAVHTSKSKFERSGNIAHEPGLECFSCSA